MSWRRRLLVRVSGRVIEIKSVRLLRRQFETGVGQTRMVN